MDEMFERPWSYKIKWCTVVKLSDGDYISKVFETYDEALEFGEIFWARQPFKIYKLDKDWEDWN